MELYEPLSNNKPLSDDKIISSQTPATSIVYIGHIPPYFSEPLAHRFFSQFGQIKRLIWLRSRKTGRMKGYGFIQFRFEEVAKIVAQTLECYVIGSKTLVCKLLNPQQIHPHLFQNCKKRFFLQPRHELFQKQYQKCMKQQKDSQTRQAFLTQKMKKLKAKGISLPWLEEICSP